ncbi:hypothetical protein QBC44DRAFT_303634 [Cladorrhinum sp. PSN332]|nr:hypothetical protein QBC44DRAFT_303634 [Cladorrhinum sp. PSN332]
MTETEQPKAANQVNLVFALGAFRLVEFARRRLRRRELGFWSAGRESTPSDTCLIISGCAIQNGFDCAKNDLASSYEETGLKVPDMEEILEQYDAVYPGNRGCTFQLDLRGEDFARTVAWFRYRRTSSLNILLKGYNRDYATVQDLEHAIAKHPCEQDHNDMPLRKKNNVTYYNIAIIFIFYSYPIIELALKPKGIYKTVDEASLEERTSLGYEHLYSVTEQHTRSFINLRITRYPQIIPEIVYNGLGLGYNIKTGEVLDPRNHNPIIDEEIDEYAKLNRAELLHKSWDEWLKQGGEDLVEAMREINGPFLANTCNIVAGNTEM